MGVGGPGAHGVRIARLIGAVPVIAVDPLPAARERALAFGADLPLDPGAPDFADAVSEATGGQGRLKPAPLSRHLGSMRLGWRGD